MLLNSRDELRSAVGSIREVVVCDTPATVEEGKPLAPQRSQRRAREPSGGGRLAGDGYQPCDDLHTSQTMTALGESALPQDLLQPQLVAKLEPYVHRAQQQRLTEFNAAAVNPDLFAFFCLAAIFLADQCSDSFGLLFERNGSLSKETDGAAELLIDESPKELDLIRGDVWQTPKGAARKIPAALGSIAKAGE